MMIRTAMYFAAGMAAALAIPFVLFFSTLAVPLKMLAASGFAIALKILMRRHRTRQHPHGDQSLS